LEPQEIAKTVRSGSWQTKSNLAFSVKSRPHNQDTRSGSAAGRSERALTSAGGVDWETSNTVIELPENPNIELRDGAYFLAGTRISLASIACAVRRGETVEEILEDFPALKSRQKLEGAVAFIEAHPGQIDAFLAEEARAWKEALKLNPPELVEKIRRYREERNLRPA
jgi:uncharacterized protein (DUF433 family)